MERMTIDVGIDLGTTTSCIAVLEGVNPRVIRNNESAEFTPSAVSYDKKSRIHIGNIAKNQLLSSDKNERHDVSLAFKRNMGQPGPFITFKVNNKQMTPIELSAEILKELRNDAKRNLGQEIMAAAISIPAAFESPQSTATDRAAGLAGFSLCPLIQEPVAAALTYGFQTKSDRVFWMIYDFGGGTFDAAIMQVRDEQIQVVNHGGDNRLGGGDIDKAIVEKLLVPEINKECRLTDADWKELFPSLMYLTEKRKIPLSIEQEVDIEIPEHILHGGYERTIKRSEIETLAEPFIERSIEICKQVLQEKRLTPSDIEKLILVGGPTLMPIFREMLTYKLGIALESKENPITVVARGAAIFAGNQLNTKKAKGDKPVSIPGKFSIELDYQPIGDETEPLIGGKVTSFKDQSFQGFNIEFADSRTGWRSGMISLSADGKFIADIHAERDCTNNYLIELKDPQGSSCDVIPNSFNYTVGRTIVNQIMTHNISVALANNEVAVFFSKGDLLPNKKRRVDFQTTKTLRKGDSGTVLKIPVVEGENKRADRNHEVGFIEVKGNSIDRDLPIGSPLEITIEVDESRIFSVKAYFPILDEEFDASVNLEYPEISSEDLKRQTEHIEARLANIKERAQKIASSTAEEKLAEIETIRLVDEVDRSFNPTQEFYKNSSAKAQNARIEIEKKLDEIESLIEWPALVKQAEDLLNSSGVLISEHGTNEDKEVLERLTKETRRAISDENEDMLGQKINSLMQLGFEVLARMPAFWVNQLEMISEKKSEIGNQQEADRLIKQAYRAITNQDFDGLRDAVIELYRLMPETTVEEIRAYGSTIITSGN